MRTIEELLGKARNRIKLVGVEVEGGWNKLPTGTDGVIRDGSVSFPEPKMPEEIYALLNSSLLQDAHAGNRLYKTWKAKVQPQHIGELVSPAMKLSEMEGWVKKFYPQHSNVSCGLHLHMSFNTDLTYQRLMNQDYEKEVLRLMKAWASSINLPLDHPFWLRVEGFDARHPTKRVKSEFCRVGSNNIDKQARIDRKLYNHGDKINRYTAINYSHATHGTVEIRFLPMFEEVSQAVSALNELAKITNAFILSRIEEARLHIKESLADEMSATREEIRECV